MTDARIDARGLAGREDLPPRGARIHFVGIGGAGMRGLALLLARAGYVVSGSDRGGVSELAELRAAGATLHGDHGAGHVEGADLVIRSSAVTPDHVEVRAAREAGIPVLRRARAMGALLNGSPLVAISGTHGKTTITAMTGYACEAAGLDPRVLVGGRVAAWRGFARPGGGVAVVEADEFDRSFLELDPTLAVVSSLEPEHLDTYGDFDAVREAYAEFAGRAAARDGVLYCADDAGARALGESLAGARSYGFGAGAWLRIESPDAAGATRFEWPGGTIEVRLCVPGRHNALNAAAAFAAARLSGGDIDAVARGLEAFPGVGRRLEALAERSGVTVVDDYAHHPTEVAASIAGLRAADPGRRVEVVFQPHLYTRTRDFAAEFGAALEAADRAWVLPLYPAREAPIEGVSSALITEAAPRVTAIDRETAVRRAREAVDAPGEAGGGTVVCYMGAGDVTDIAHEAAGRLLGDSDALGA